MHELVRKALKGDIGAEQEMFEQLHKSFNILIRRRLPWASQEEAEDITQDACRTIAEKYCGVKFEKGFAQWSYGVLQNKIGNVIKKRDRNREDSRSIDDHPDRLLAVNPDPGFRMDLLNCFRDLVNSGGRYARVLNLSYQGFCTSDICARLGISKQNCYSTLNRARSRLMDCLQQAGVAV